MADPKLVIVVRTDLKLRRGKESAQVGHASMRWAKRLHDFARRYSAPGIRESAGIALIQFLSGDCDHSYNDVFADNDRCELCGGLIDAKRSDSPLTEWLNGLEKKIVVGVDSLAELEALVSQAAERGVECNVIKDAGLTEIPPGTITGVAFGPDLPERLDPFLGHLKLR